MPDLLGDLANKMERHVSERGDEGGGLRPPNRGQRTASSVQQSPPHPSEATQATSTIQPSVSLPSGPTPGFTPRADAADHSDGAGPSRSKSSGSPRTSCDAEMDAVVDQMMGKGASGGTEGGQPNGEVVSEREDSISRPASSSHDGDASRSQDVDHSDDFLSNGGKPDFRPAVGGGKGIRMQSYASMEGHDQDKLASLPDNKARKDYLDSLHSPPPMPSSASPAHARHAPPKPSAFSPSASDSSPPVHGDASPANNYRRTPSAINKDPTTSSSKWAMIKQKLVRNPTAFNQAPAKQAAALSLTDELMLGSLSVLMMKMSVDRDEKGLRRVPVFIHHVKFKISDSIGGLGNHPVFRIECDYGDGRVKWVLYRTLRDFLSLHGHYKAAGVARLTGKSTVRGSVDIPEFPKSSIPYLRRKGKADSDKEEGEPQTPTPTVGRSKGKEALRSDFAKDQRKALETYLLDLVKAVMLRPEANRLIRFLEISALTFQLAVKGGHQGKAGYLRVGNVGDVASKTARPAMFNVLGWREQRKPKWWIVRESYLVCVKEPDSVQIFDVFFFDQDFTIERPKRIYRKGTQALKSAKDKTKDQFHHQDSDDEDDESRLARMEGDIHGIDQATIATIPNNKKDSNTSHHTFYVHNSQGRLKLVAKNVREMQQFILSLEKMATDSIWAGKNRFDSFAPIRLNVAAQWMVDGRDYLWNVSRALLNATKCVYIHDWWLSPELYMRRPGQEKYRLDNILKKKAEEGVQIYVIVYNEVSNKTTPTDSLYTKKSLRDLHPNIHVQRSPSHFQTGTFYWAHHEKMCVIDESVAFMGGVDLCFGRWDTPQHSLIDDEEEHVWPGKDYSNPRVLDFHTLSKPFEDMYDRDKVPRMPWHDIAMQMVGQPARDLCRHFSQRWNYLLRMKNHSITMPFLVPPPDFTIKELEQQKLTGTCEIQVCRSAGPWSMGTANRVEHSIQNAYLKAIQLSEHFVYIENQFFITSTVVDGIVIENQIGDALVKRIIQAHNEGTAWRACIVIPLLPGFTYPIDSDAASSVRLIVECQNKSICRGPNSIFGRLRQEGIDPMDYISFFSLRGWGKFKNGTLTTEQVYIHAKCMIVDDRLVIIGSANINERSQRGDRDSELASVIRDTDMIDGRMNGQPYQVGRFAHTLRLRLMREHLGIDVDEMEEDDLLERDPVVPEHKVQIWDPNAEQQATGEGLREDEGVIQTQTTMDRAWIHAASVARQVGRGQAEVISHTAGKLAAAFKQEKNDIAKPSDDVEIFEINGEQAKGYSSAVVPTLEERHLAEHNLIDGPLRRGEGGIAAADIADTIAKNTGESSDVKKVDADEAYDRLSPDVNRVLSNSEAKDVKKSRSSPLPVKVSGEDGLHDSIPAAPLPGNEGEEEKEHIEKQLEDVQRHRENEAHSSKEKTRGRRGTRAHPWEMPLPTPKIDPFGLEDPLDERFWKDTWTAVAVHNTEIFRKVFRCIPDDLVTTWTHYRENAAHADKFHKSSNEGVHPAASTSNDHGLRSHAGGSSGQGAGQGAGGGGSGGGVVGGGTGGGSVSFDGGEGGATKTEENGGLGRAKSMKRGGRSGTVGSASEGDPTKPSGNAEGWSSWEKERMEELLGEVRGHLVVYPTRFLETEDLANNFLFNSDKILPLPIYD